MIHPHLVVTYRLDHQSTLFTPRNDRVYSHYEFPLLFAGTRFQTRCPCPPAPPPRMAPVRSLHFSRRRRPLRGGGGQWITTILAAATLSCVSNSIRSGSYFLMRFGELCDHGSERL